MGEGLDGDLDVVAELEGGMPYTSQVSISGGGLGLILVTVAEAKTLVENRVGSPQLPRSKDHFPTECSPRPASQGSSNALNE